VGDSGLLRQIITRRHLMGAAGVGALALSRPGWAQTMIDLPLPGGPGAREITTAFPQKGPMILQRTRPPLLETPFEVFDKGVFTPNDQFYVRWHWALIPTDIDAGKFALTVRGHVNQTLSLSLNDILHGLPSVQLAAVNQCSGNSRGFFQPRVPGGEWANGAMGNALWTGVRLKDVLDKAGVKAGAVQVRFKGLDEPVVADAPHFMKSLDIDHARDGEVMIAYAMNGEQLPLVNGFPLRLVVPGWYATYWVKMLSDIEVLDQPDTNYWTKVAYTIPDTPHASVKPGETDVKMIPINRMVPRSFVTNCLGPAGEGRCADDGARHRVRRRLRCRKGGLFHRWRQKLATGATRKRRRQVWIPAVADATRAAVAGKVRFVDPLHQQQWRSAARHTQLESGRLHAQRRGIGRCAGGLTEYSQCLAISYPRRFCWAQPQCLSSLAPRRRSN
jgi:DMSO/TMAO reductase YedYZ molybdopterin-dependent catalytic subunit